MTHPKFEKKVQSVRSFLSKNKWFSRATPIVIGLLATTWFVIRVVPKPSRAGYPCMKVAYPFMTAFILWIISFTGIFASYKLLVSSLRRKHLLMIGLSLTFLLVAIGFHIYTNTDKVFAQSPEAVVHPVNEPFGEGQGVLPGRVTWAWNPDATNENCTNDLTKNDGYYLNKNNNQAVIDLLVQQSVQQIGNQPILADAWNAIFRSFNIKKGKGDVSYVAGETVFLKVNMGTAGWATKPDFTRQSWAMTGYAETSPQAIVAILKQLVNVVGVPQNKIIVADPIAHMYAETYQIIHDIFPNVIFGDKNPLATYGRTVLHQETTPVIYYSDNGTVLTETSDCLYTEMQNADYMINIAALKAHARAGITLTAKNHYGSHTRGSAAHLHNGLVAPENDIPVKTGYGRYRTQVDLMGSKYLGQNTLLYIVDGLWGGTEATETPVKWKMAPFNNDWPSSFFMSLDQVALESVCFDFLRSEAPLNTAAWKNRPLMDQGVDDYLHQAASSANWPKDIVYDPDGSGTPLPSLGVHEHWNNATDKQYSRNIGFSKGIELIKILPKKLSGSNFQTYDVNQAILVVDGVGDESIWENVSWQYIDQVWKPYSDVLSAADFNGRFKVLWSATQNKLYVLAETTDDDFVDGYVYPASNYPDYDILEIFMDENKSQGTHIFDNGAENAENAFSYHIVINRPADGQTTSDKKVLDIAGKSWSNLFYPNYADHFPEFTVKRDGNKLTWEFSLVVYKDTYDPTKTAAQNTAAISTLAANKTIGFAMAYCDADGGVGRDNFIGSDWGPLKANNEFNDYWMLADNYATMTLKAANPITAIISRPVASAFANAMKLYPNPSNGVFSLELESLDPTKPVVVSVYNSQGQMVESSTYSSSQSSLLHPMNLSGMARGNYIIRVVNGKNSASQKIQIIN